MQAIDEHVIVRSPRKATKTKGDIELPDVSAIGEHQHGEVVCVSLDSSLEPGDLVIFDKNGLRDLELNGRKYQAIIESMIFMQITREEALGWELSLDFEHDPVIDGPEEDAGGDETEASDDPAS